MNTMKIRSIFVLYCLIAPFDVSAFCGSSFRYEAVGGKIVFKSANAGPTDMMISNPDVVLEDVDMGSFQSIPGPMRGRGDCGSPYAKDKRKVFYKGKVISDEPSSFKVEGTRQFTYGEDSGFVYVEGSKIEKEGFTILKQPRTSDVLFLKNRSAVYALGKKIDADPDTFQVFACSITKDKNSVFVGGVRKKTPIAASFKPTTPDSCSFSDEQAEYVSEWTGRAYKLFRLQKSDSSSPPSKEDVN